MYQAAENRYETMEYKRCGRSGLKLPRVALGLWQNFGLEKTITDQEEILCHAFDHAGSHTLILRTTTDIRQTALRRKISVRRLRIVLVHTGMSL